MIKNFTPGMEYKIYNLVKDVFDKYVGCDYSEEGCQTFYEFIKPKKIKERFVAGNLILVYEESTQIVGMVELRDDNHICLFFVKSQNHQQGIGKQLFDSVLKKITGKTDYIEVNSSPFAEKIYNKLGFKKKANLTEKNGIKFIPMKFKF